MANTGVIADKKILDTISRLQREERDWLSVDVADMIEILHRANIRLTHLLEDGGYQID